MESEDVDDSKQTAGQSGSSYAQETYLARPERQRSGLALCLSGGGFRASLFHLGALRRLAELGVLSKIDNLTSVSGGSITAAHLATSLRSWPAPGDSFPPDQFEGDVAGPLREFAGHDIRTLPLAKWLLLPWNWLKTDTPIEAVTRRYERDLTPLSLVDLPVRPGFILCATDVMYGVCWTFTRDKMGDYKVGTLPSPRDFSLGRAVAASSCFPPIFDAMRLRVGAGRIPSGTVPTAASDAGAMEDIRLSDGGVYDNLGLEPVWKSARYVLVSDGGAVFRFSSTRTLPLRLLRYSDILSNQVGSLRKRWLIAGFLAGQGPGRLRGSYWGIGSAPGHYRPGAAGYSVGLVDDVISRVRTDLDAFSESEAFVLENHGYCLAEAGVQEHVPELLGTAPLPFRIPHPELMEEARVRQELKDSSIRHLLGRGWQRSLFHR